MTIPKKNQSPKKEVSFDAIARYTDWPKRLIEEKKKIHRKTQKEVNREFNLEKWNETMELLAKTKKQTLEEIENEIYPLNSHTLFAQNGKLWKTTHGYSVNQHLKLYRRIIIKYLSGASSLTELGAGYGSKILALGQMKPFAKTRLVMGELTANGRNSAEIFAKKIKRQMEVGFCDFRTLRIDKGLVPRDSVIFTSYAMHYVPVLPEGIIDYFIRLNPKVVIHFEPLYEVLGQETIHDLLCKEYFRQNNYTLNLYSRIKQAEKDKKIKILEEHRKVIGQNPLLPISIIVWSVK